MADKEPVWISQNKGGEPSLAYILQEDKDRNRLQVKWATTQTVDWISSFQIVKLSSKRESKKINRLQFTAEEPKQKKLKTPKKAKAKASTNAGVKTSPGDPAGISTTEVPSQSTAPSPSPAPAPSPDRFLCQRIAKKFDGIPYKGTVLWWGKPKQGYRWLVEFDDGEREHFFEKQLQAAIKLYNELPVNEEEEANAKKNLEKFQWGDYTYKGAEVAKLFPTEEYPEGKLFGGRVAACYWKNEPIHVKNGIKTKPIKTWFWRIEYLDGDDEEWDVADLSKVLALRESQLGICHTEGSRPTKACSATVPSVTDDTEDSASAVDIDSNSDAEEFEVEAGKSGVDISTVSRCRVPCFTGRSCSIFLCRLVASDSDEWERISCWAVLLD